MRIVAHTGAVAVSVLFNEPKLLKSGRATNCATTRKVSVLFNEPKLLKCIAPPADIVHATIVSVLFNEPKLLK